MYFIPQSLTNDCVSKKLSLSTLKFTCEFWILTEHWNSRCKNARISSLSKLWLKIHESDFVSISASAFISRYGCMFDKIFWNDAKIIFQRHKSKMTKCLLDNHKSGDKSEGPIFISVILNAHGLLIILTQTSNYVYHEIIFTLFDDFCWYFISKY